MFNKVLYGRPQYDFNTCQTFSPRTRGQEPAGLNKGIDRAKNTAFGFILLIVSGHIYRSTPRLNHYSNTSWTMSHSTERLSH